MSALPAFNEAGNGSLVNEQLAAFLSDPETRSVVQSVVTERWPNAVLQDGGLSTALGALSQNPSPPILIVDVSGSEDPNAGARSLLALCDPATRVIAIGTVNDIDYYRRLTELGVSDYLVKPVDPETLVKSLEAGARSRPVLRAVEDEELERNVVSVVGVRGGVGATTLAVNLAWIVGHEMQRNCAIVDLDLQFGTVGLQLDLEPSHGLREALENPDRIDALFIASAMANEGENLFVLSAEEPFDERVDYTSDACTKLINALPDDLKDVFLDVPSRSVVENPSIIQQSQKIVLVSDLSLVGMRDVARLSRLCADAAPDAALHIVLNRVGMAAKGEIPKAEFVKGAELPVSHIIPFDPKLAAMAGIAGKSFPEIASRSAPVKSMRKLAADLVERKNRPPSKTKASALFSLLRKGT
jgi:pilus assembly protein CpaE